MIIDQNPKEYFDKIVDAEPQNRSWVLSVVINFILGIVLAVTFFVMDSRATKAEVNENQAKRELAIERANSLKDGKDCIKEIKDAQGERDLYWQTRFDNLQDSYNRELKARASKLESKIDKLTKDTRNIKTRVGI